MPITYGQFTRQLKALPLTLHADGTATLTVRFAFVGDDGVFAPTEERVFLIAVDAVNAILDAPPRAGMSRRDDLSLAIYTHLVTAGLIEAGQVS